MLTRFRKGAPNSDAHKSGIKKTEKRTEFQKAELQESSEVLSNPGCGWYHVYTFKAQPPGDGRPVEEEAWLDESCRQEQLALALIDIGAFRVSPLSEEALDHIGRIMDFFHRNQKQLLLRFVYDTEGKGMEREPLTLNMVKRHMEQIGGAVRPYLEDILVMQGVFVGNWGEMHGSKFLDDGSLRELIAVLYRITEGRCFLAVRTPAQWRRVTGNPKMGRELEERLALFNDGIFGSETDLGTYGTVSRAEAGETGSWSRAEELEWQRQFMDAVPNGGEILSCEPLKGYRQAAEDLEEMHVCYLNSIYHPDQLDYWRGERVEESGCWQGLSGYEYIGRHLGYRFTVSDVTERNHELQIVVENNGFGNLCQETECFLVTEGETGVPGYKRLDTDARNWKSGQKTLLTAALPRSEYGAGSSIYLQLRRKSDGRILRFANQGAEEKVPLGHILNS